MTEGADWIELVERARSGDVDARDDLLLRFGPLVRATAARLVPAGLIDDVTQETVAVAIVRLPSLRTAEAFPSWLRLIARQQAARLRQQVSRTVPLGTAADHVADDASDASTVVDALAPVRRGGTVAMTGPTGTGQVVIALELLYRLGRSPGSVACVAVGGRGVGIGSRADLGHLATEPGLPGPCAVILTGDPAEAVAAADAGRRLAAALAARDRDVVLLLDGPTASSVDQSAVTGAAGLVGAGSVTVVALHDVVGCDATLTFSVEQLALGIFPAIDPVGSTSIFPISAAATAARAQLTHAASTRRWFAQDLFVAREATGVDGAWIEPIDAAAELATLTG